VEIVGIFSAGGLNGDGFFGEEYQDDWEQGEWSGGRAQHYRREPRSVKCRICGFENLRWIETPNGWRTAYSTGLLAGKLHTCGGGI
jgi:hypothetical protein